MNSSFGHRKKYTAATLLGTAVCIVLIILLTGRVYLPYWVKDYVNAQIAALDGYGGSVGDIEISLWRGAYKIHALDIRKIRGQTREPFVTADMMDLSIQWKALWHGKILAKVDLHDCALTFSKNQSGRGADWESFIDNLTPFDIDQLTIKDGKVAYVDHTVGPDVNLYIHDIQAEVTNLRNVEGNSDQLPSALHVQGKSIGNGILSLNGRGNILKNVPDFALDIKLENAALPAFNNYTRRAAALDFNSGEISIYSELAAIDGHITGYIKPIATRVEMISLKDAKNPFGLLWETLAATFIEIFKNHPTDQFALRIPVEGNIINPQGDAWAGFWSIFENAFGKAFPRATDGSLDMGYIMNKYGVNAKDPPR